MSCHCNGSGGEQKQEDSDERGSINDGVVNGIRGVMEEKVVFDMSSEGEDRGYLNVVAFVDSRYEIEGCEAESEDGSGHRGCRELESAGWLGLNQSQKYIVSDVNTIKIGRQAAGLTALE